ncbi:MAG: tryptophan synthase subunit alpha [Candidatus Omnitrophica bacterium]|nr:tryptophan synthase subunit alpha [Candidatus Omnitrophota bacterium]
MNRIDKTFKRLRQQRKKAFIAFITAGYPSLRTTEELVLGFARAGVDIVELGIPFSDPIADGPVIQQSSFEALKKKTTLVKVLSLVKGLRRKTGIPVCFMSYYNPLYAFGPERFLRRARESGVDGLIIPDLPCEEAGDFLRLCDKYGIDLIQFIAPTTTRQRCRKICGLARGFIYYISLTGTTGVRKKLAQDISGHLRSVRSMTRKPVCAGFGISNRRQVAKVSQLCDGVIVGSAIVNKVGENTGKKDLAQRVTKFVKGLMVR